MNFTLDDIKAAADKKYGSLIIPLGEDGEAELVNALRLPKEKRKALSKLQDRLGSDGGEEEQEEVLAETLRTVCRTDSQADKLLAALGDDLAMIVTVFERYVAGTELGEASGSQS